MYFLATYYPWCQILTAGRHDLTPLVSKTGQKPVPGDTK